MDPAKVLSMMNYAIEAIGDRQFDLDFHLHDRDDFGREFVLRRGLELGAEHFHDDEFVGPQRDHILNAYRALGAPPPASWVKSDVCLELLAHLRARARGEDFAR